jgi:hypothetical protein
MSNIGINSGNTEHRNYGATGSSTRTSHSNRPVVLPSVNQNDELANVVAGDDVRISINEQRETGSTGAQDTGSAYFCTYSPTMSKIFPESKVFSVLTDAGALICYVAASWCAQRWGMPPNVELMDRFRYAIFGFTLLSVFTSLLESAPRERGESIPKHLLKTWFRDIMLFTGYGASTSLAVKISMLYFVSAAMLLPDSAEYEQYWGNYILTGLSLFVASVGLSMLALSRRGAVEFFNVFPAGINATAALVISFIAIGLSTAGLLTKSPVVYILPQSLATGLMMMAFRYLVATHFLAYYTGYEEQIVDTGNTDAPAE